MGCKKSRDTHKQIQKNMRNMGQILMQTQKKQVRIQTWGENQNKKQEQAWTGSRTRTRIPWLRHHCKNGTLPCAVGQQDGEACPVVFPRDAHADFCECGSEVIRKARNHGKGQSYIVQVDSNTSLSTICITHSGITWSRNNACINTQLATFFRTKRQKGALILALG